MLSSETVTLPLENGEIGRVQCVRLDSWDTLDFFSPAPSAEAFERICTLYSEFIVPRMPIIFGRLVLFRLPEGVGGDIPLRGYADRLSAAGEALRRGVRIAGGRPVFRTDEARSLWAELEECSAVRIVCGRLGHTKILPVGDSFGLMSESERQARLKVNASFFTMDCFDCASPFDVLGTPFGLRVKNGLVLSPPLFEREALRVGRDGTVRVTVPRLEELTVEVNGRRYKNGENAVFYSRPRRRVTPHGSGADNVIIGRRVAAVRGAGTEIPASGFIMRTKTPLAPGDELTYLGMEDTAFAIQVGNSILRDGEKTVRFISPFYNIRRPFSTEFPPSLYPLDFEKAVAPRIALGADRQGRPMLAWVEGRGKFGHVPGEEGYGASLADMADICALLGMYNAVNLDGGGSAQILLNNERALRVSDRRREDASEVERAVPSGLIVR